MRALRTLLISVILTLLAAPAFAQNWVVADGTNQLRVRSTLPAVTIRQNGTGKILSLQGSAGTTLWSVAANGDVTWTGHGLFADGTAAAPSIASATNPNLGLYFSNPAGNAWFFTAASVARFGMTGTSVSVGSDVTFNWASGTSAAGTLDLTLARDGANVLAQRSGTNPQTYNIYNTFTDATHNERFEELWSGNVLYLTTIAIGGGTFRPMVVGTKGSQASLTFMTDGGNRWHIDGTAGHFLADTDAALDIGATGANRPRSLYLAAPAVTVGTDVTVVDSGDHTRQRYSATITPATANAANCFASFKAAALTADCNIATLPAGMRLVSITADVTAGFTCSGTCSGTKVVQCGSSAGAVDILAAGFTVAATGTAGLTDAQLGSAMVRAAAIQGGFLPSWSATTPVSCRFTSGTGNWGNAAATFVNAGSIKFTLITEQVK